MPLALPPDAVSRAWLKMEEAIALVATADTAWRTRCAEIGSAPGGASQALLARGMEVIGIDPAEMAPAVLSTPRFHARSPPGSTQVPPPRVSQNSLADGRHERRAPSTRSTPSRQSSPIRR